MYDFIGDIHGHYDELIALLHRLGYRPDAGGIFRHPAHRRLVFLGDYIDRGPKIRETVQLVRATVAHAGAIALMGNHEYNALGYATPDPAGGYLRPHTPQNTHQHQATLDAFAASPELHAEWQECLGWFYTLPLFLELPEGLRAVHACWDARHMAYLQAQLPDNRLTPAFLRQASPRGTPARDAVDVVLKGRETALPNGLTFLDKDNHARRLTRIKWWRDPAQVTYDDYYFSIPAELSNLPVDVAALSDPSFYQDSTPVFFGHYWLNDEPRLLAPNAVCLDYSVAKQGKLVGYRWQGERTLRPEGLVWV